ncbi:MAG: hypothetical protein ABIK28_04820, partial [Planctomycetota bacterium]
MPCEPWTRCTGCDRLSAMSASKKIILYLCIGLLAASQSANIIRIGDAHPIALAAWRLLIASLLLA